MSLCSYTTQIFICFNLKIRKTGQLKQDKVQMTGFIYIIHIYTHTYISCSRSLRRRCRGGSGLSCQILVAREFLCKLLVFAALGKMIWLGVGWGNDELSGKLPKQRLRSTVWMQGKQQMTETRKAMNYPKKGSSSQKEKIMNSSDLLNRPIPKSTSKQFSECLCVQPCDHCTSVLQRLEKHLYKTGMIHSLYTPGAHCLGLGDN